MLSHPDFGEIFGRASPKAVVYMRSSAQVESWHLIDYTKEVMK